MISNVACLSSFTNANLTFTNIKTIRLVHFWQSWKKVRIYLFASSVLPTSIRSTSVSSVSPDNRNRRWIRKWIRRWPWWRSGESTRQHHWRWQQPVVLAVWKARRSRSSRWTRTRGDYRGARIRRDYLGTGRKRMWTFWVWAVWRQICTLSFYGQMIWFQYHVRYFFNCLENVLNFIIHHNAYEVIICIFFLFLRIVCSLTVVLGNIFW